MQQDLEAATPKNHQTRNKSWKCNRERRSKQCLPIRTKRSQYRHHGATSVRYIEMGTATKVQYDDQWDLEETVRQVEQKFCTDLRTIADETTNDEKSFNSKRWYA